jgi:hypothetical protein
MLSGSNLTALDEAGLRFIVGSRSTKAPGDLESHFRWHGDAFEGGQIIDTITPKNRRLIENDTNLKAEPVWDPAQHRGSWRAVWAYSTKPRCATTRPSRCRRTEHVRSSKAKFWPGVPVDTPRIFSTALYILVIAETRSL